MSQRDDLTDQEIRDLGYERTRKGWVLIPKGRPEGQQLSILEGRRFDPTGVAVKLLMAESFARTHAVAAALGREKRRDGTYGTLRNGKDGVGVLIGPTQRKRVCAVLDITPDYFSDFARECVKLNIAHRCQRGTLFLWLAPHLELCPGCGEEVRLSAGIESGYQPDSIRLSAGQIVPVGGDAMRDGKGDAHI